MSTTEIVKLEETYGREQAKEWCSDFVRRKALYIHFIWGDEPELFDIYSNFIWACHYGYRDDQWEVVHTDKWYNPNLRQDGDTEVSEESRHKYLCYNESKIVDNSKRRKYCFGH